MSRRMLNLSQLKFACIRIHGPDGKGILAANSHLLDKCGCSIIKTEQFTDPQLNHYYQRSLFSMSTGCEHKHGPTISADSNCRSSINKGFHDEHQLEIEYELSQFQKRFGLQFVHVDWRNQPKRMAVFVSKYDHCLWEILLRHQAKELDCEISAVISNHPDLRHVVEAFGIPFHVFPIDEGNKTEQEEKEIALLKNELNVDLIVLARYMQVLSDGFLDAFEPDQIINIHHSFLPAFKGANPYQKAYERGVKLVGATVSTVG